MSTTSAAIDITGVHFLESSKLNQFHAKAKEVKENPSLFCELEISEAYERLGIAQFYEGKYREALINLHKCLKDPFEALKPPRSICHTKFIIGCIYFRLGFGEKGELFLLAALEVAQEQHFADLTAAAQANLAIVYLRDGNFSAAEVSARQSIETATAIYPLKSRRFLRHVEVLFAVYIRGEEYTKAENLLLESAFPEKESALMLAGVKYASGKKHEAYRVLRSLDIHSNNKGDATTTNNDDTECDTAYQEELSKVLSKLAITHNLGLILDNKDDTLLQESTSASELVAGTLLNRKLGVDYLYGDRPGEVIDGLLTELDPFIACEYTGSPAIVPFDDILHPMVVRSTILLSQARRLLYSQRLTRGLDIQVGGVYNDETDKTDSALKDIDRMLKEATFALTACSGMGGYEALTGLPPVIIPATNNVNTTDITTTTTNNNKITGQRNTGDGGGVLQPGAVELGDAAIAATAVLANLVTPPSAPASVAPSRSGGRRGSVSSGMGGNRSIMSEGAGSMVSASDPVIDDLVDVLDIVLAKDYMSQFRALNDLKRGDISNSYVGKTSNRLLRDNHQAEINPVSGRLVVRPKLKPPKPKGEPAMATVVDEPNALNSPTAKPPPKGKIALQKAAAVAAAAAAAAAQVTASTKTLDAIASFKAPGKIAYKPNDHDLNTVRSEILPLMNSFGRDEAALGTAWVLANCGGVGFGPLGQNCPNFTEDEGYDMQRLEAARQTTEFLIEVRNRLKDTDKLLTPEYITVYENSDENGGTGAVGAGTGGESSSAVVEGAPTDLAGGSGVSTTELTATVEGGASPARKGRRILNPKKKGGTLNARIIVAILLLKLNVQLNYKMEAGQQMTALENMCKRMNFLNGGKNNRHKKGGNVVGGGGSFSLPNGQSVDDGFGGDNAGDGGAEGAGFVVAGGGGGSNDEEDDGGGVEGRGGGGGEQRGGGEVLDQVAKRKLQREKEARETFANAFGGGGGCEVYLTIAAKFRFEYELWSVKPELEKVDLVKHYIQKVLPCGKHYLLQTQRGYHDIQLERDALKKLANLFLSISNITFAYADHMTVQQAKEDARDGLPTMEKLEKLSKDDLDEKDKENICWVHKFARMRALMYTRQMRNLHSVHDEYKNESKQQ